MIDSLLHLSSFQARSSTKASLLGSKTSQSREPQESGRIWQFLKPTKTNKSGLTIALSIGPVLVMFNLKCICGIDIFGTTRRSSIPWISSCRILWIVMAELIVFYCGRYIQILGLMRAICSTGLIRYQEDLKVLKI